MDGSWIFETAGAPHQFDGEACSPLIRITALAALSQALDDHGVSVRQLLRQAGFDDEEIATTRQFLPISKFALALELAAERTGDNLLRFHLGQHSLSAPHHAVVMACSTAANLRSALDTLVRFKSLVFQCVSGLANTPAGTRLEIRHCGMTTNMSQICDLSAARWTRFLRQYLGFQWRPSGVGLARERPRDETELQQWFGQNIYYRQPYMSLEIPQDDMVRLMPSADPNLHMILTSYLQRLEGGHETRLEFANQVRKFISDHIADERLTADKVARALGTSVSEMNRRLRLSGTTYKSLHDATRKAYAESYLNSTDLRLAEIAYLLGFSDQSALTRSCRRWFGMPPLKYRSLHAFNGASLNGDTNGEPGDQITQADGCLRVDRG